MSGATNYHFHATFITTWPVIKGAEELTYFSMLSAISESLLEIKQIIVQPLQENMIRVALESEKRLKRKTKILTHDMLTNEDRPVCSMRSLKLSFVLLD